MRLSPFALLLVGACGLSQPGVAAQHAKPICDDFKTEQGLLHQQGVNGDMAKGPEWAKANLSGERLKLIERLIFVDEQLAFRCPQPKRPVAAGEEEDDAAPAKTPTKAAAGAKTAVPKAKAAPQKKILKAPTEPAQAANQSAATKPSSPKPTAKPKVDDAYSPTAAGKASSGGQQPQ